MLKVDKKQVKIISLAIAVVFIIGILGIALSQGGKTYAASAGSSSNIGVVNKAMIVQQHPDLAQAQAAMQAEIESAKKDFDAKSQGMNDQEKQAYYAQLQQRLSMKQKEIVSPVLDKVDAAIKSVADAKGLSIVMDKENVVYGGQDITDDVIKKITGK